MSYISTHSGVVHELVHSTSAQSGAHHICHSDAGIDVADQLRLSLAGICPLLEQDDLGLL